MERRSDVDSVKRRPFGESNFFDFFCTTSCGAPNGRPLALVRRGVDNLLWSDRKSSEKRKLEGFPQGVSNRPVDAARYWGGRETRTWGVARGSGGTLLTICFYSEKMNGAGRRGASRVTP